MAIKTWVTDGKYFFQIDVCARSRAKRELRVQKRESGVLEAFEAEKDPEATRKKLNRIESHLADEARRELAEREGAGISWADLVERWEKALLEESRLPSDGLRTPIKWSTAHSQIQSVIDFTSAWMKKPAAKITPADVEDAFRKMQRIGYSNCRVYNVKVAINKCFKWGIMRRLIPGISIPPTHGFGISRKDSKRPEILNDQQIQTLLSEADRKRHPWRQVWKGAFHTGGRSGELFWLKRKHVDLVDHMILLEEKWNFQSKIAEPLKDREWRQVPINTDLHELFMQLGIPNMQPEEFVFPRINAWRNGEAARVLRDFCEEIKIPSICFHTLRACWATQLLKHSVPEVKVMAMGGWEDAETMHRYIRLAGIEIKGATESLSFGKRERPARVLKLIPSGTA